MTTDPNAALVEALEHFLREAKETSTRNGTGMPSYGRRLRCLLSA